MNPEQWLSLKWNGGSTMSDRWLNQSKIIHEDKIISAERPSEILKNSIVTPSPLAAVLNFKYVNAMPLYRLEQEFKRNDIHISRQTMSSW